MLIEKIKHFLQKCGVSYGFILFCAGFKTECDVQINIIDINDQIPIFEKSDVSISNVVFDITNQAITKHLGLIHGLLKGQCQKFSLQS